MAQIDKEKLKQCYINTIYSVLVDDEQFEFKIDQSLPKKFETKLVDANNKTAVILTAWNPQSQALSQSKNKSNNEKLKSLLETDAFTFHDALGSSIDNSWPAEESFFILGMSKNKAESLAMQFKQNAYVWIENNKEVVLEFTSLWEKV